LKVSRPVSVLFEENIDGLAFMEVEALVLEIISGVFHLFLVIKKLASHLFIFFLVCLL